MNDKLKRINLETELCIVGGGMAGMLAAISAARHGTRVVIIQDRPMFGGNASSEIRMWIRGANGEYNKETGILSELELENIYRNPTLNFSQWDAVLFGAIKNEKNITAVLNASVCDAKTHDNRITEVTAWQLTTYTWFTVKAKYFADCSGDSILAPLTGAEYTVGREAKSEYNETIPPEFADKKTMGMSCLMQLRETDHEVKFTPPSWANVYEKDEDFNKRGHDLSVSQNWWWIELGGEADSIHDTEELRDELLKTTFGIFDHIKNRGDHHAENFELVWVGFLPGKRESLRYIGEHVLTENDISAGGVFEDTVAYGGWAMDDHNPKGFNFEGAPTIFHHAPSPYGIPYRSLFSRNIENLFFAGRNISATHAALSSTRVMATCAVMGQALGTAASICVKRDLTPKEVYLAELPTLQKMLLDDGCFLPRFKREIPVLTKNCETNLTKEQKEVLFNGLERPTNCEISNEITLEKGDFIEYKLPNLMTVHTLRIVFDFDFVRSYEKEKQYKRFPMKASTLLNFEPLEVPHTIVKSFSVYGKNENGENVCILQENDNYQHILQIPIEKDLREIKIIFSETWGDEKIKLFSCDIC